METPDPRGAVSRIVAVLRKVTRIVQLAPFALLFLLTGYLLSERFLPTWALDVIDNFPIVPLTILLLLLGRILKLCVWFKTACLLPFAARIESWVDSFIITLTQNEVVIINSMLALIFITFLLLANKHFFSNAGR